MLTVISEALKDVADAKPRQRRAAVEWLLYDSAEFPEICYLAGIDAEYLRKLIPARLR